MPCYKPIKAFYGAKLASGKREIVFSSGQAQSCLDLALPCGTCVGCRLERARQWAMRCVDEASLHKDNSFITLTVNPESLSSHGRSLDVGVFQKFMKRFRKEVAPLRIRFFMRVSMGLNLGGLITMRLFSGILSLIGFISRPLRLLKRFILLYSSIGYGLLVLPLLVILHLVQQLTLPVTILRKLDRLFRIIIISIERQERFLLRSMSL